MATHMPRKRRPHAAVRRASHVHLSNTIVNPLVVHRQLTHHVRWTILKLVNNLQLIVAVYIASLLVAAELFSVFEHKPYGVSLWWAVVTALTIGYGDIAPVTVAGRVVSVLFQHFWIFGVGPLVIANIILRAQYNRDQLSNAEQRWLFDRVEQICEALALQCPPRPSDTDHGNIEA